MKTSLTTLIFFIASTALLQGQEKAPGKVTVNHDAEKKVIRVEIGGDLFTEFLYNHGGKPMLYPIIGPDNTGMTRSYPMKKGVKGEAEDHVHHTSLWFTHGEVNHANFWHNGKEKIVTDEVVKAEKEMNDVVIEAKNRWLDADGKVVCTDTTQLRLGELDGDRFIEYSVTIHASSGDVTFQDTKEGTMGIRTNPVLRLKGDVAAGSAINSAGDKDGALWGKNAAWVDYWAKIDGREVGIAIFDHPSNLRHPTTWHARDYGLIAANPFGLSNFKKMKKGTGDHTIKDGESQRFKYYFLFHKGAHEAAKIPSKYDAWRNR
jgi:hypothetical protein